MCEDSAAQAGAAHKQTELVPMRDGVRLATDVYLPHPPPAGGSAGDNSEQPVWPTLVVRTPYDRTGEELVQTARYFTSHEYAVVLQDVRGRYDSEGSFEPFVNEAEDGHDCLQWVGEQPWCSGKLGTLGTSYLAQTQSSAAVTEPPHLAAQYVSQGYGSYHRTRSRRGGAFENHRLNWIVRMAATSPEAADDEVLQKSLESMQEQLLDWMSEGYPLRRGLTPLAAVPTYEEALFNFMTRGQLDEFWQNPGLNLNPHFDRYKDVPVTWLGSWYDGYALETPQNYAALKAPKSSVQRLIMGPWPHGMSAEQTTHAGDVDFGKEASFDSLEERRRWFDYTLKEEDNGVDEEPPVRIFVMGGGSGTKLPSGRLDHGGCWRAEQEWPLARAERTPFYLHRHNRLTTERPRHPGASTTYDFDPLNPVPSTSLQGKTIFEAGGGGYNQQQDPSTGAGNTELPHAARRDVVVFQTDPLDSNTEVTGPISVILYIVSSAPDTDFTAKLIDVYPPNPDYPNGYALELTHSLQRCRYRNGYKKEELMQPGKVYKLEFPLPPTSNVFQPGHRIRVDISSSNWPKYEVNPNTGEPVGQHRRMMTAVNTIHHNLRHPSHIVLPLIP